MKNQEEMGYTFQKIEKERQRNKMNITELMQKLGLSRATYYEWQKNDETIAVKYLKAISSIFKIPVAELIEAPTPNSKNEEYRLVQDILRIIKDSGTEYGKVRTSPKGSKKRKNKDKNP